MFRKKKNKDKYHWWKPSPQTKKTLKEEADKLIGYDKTVNKSWKCRWKYFIKRQYPWYGIIELNQFKIIEMRDYMIHYGYLAEEETARQVREMSEVINLGYKILEDKYEDEAHKWLRENNCSVTIISKPIKGETLKEKIDCIKEEITRLYNRGMFEDIISEAELYLDDPMSKEAFEMRKEFIKDKDTRSVDEWLTDNKLTNEDISLSYTGEWINGKSEEENQAEYTRRFQEAYKARQDDINKYFALIAEYQYNWGD